jgi:hypothetical protein
VGLRRRLSVFSVASRLEPGPGEVARLTLAAAAPSESAPAADVAGRTAAPKYDREPSGRVVAIGIDFDFDFVTDTYADADTDGHPAAR